MALFNSYLLGRARKSVGNVTLAYTNKKNIARAKIFARKDNATPAVLDQRAKMRLLGNLNRRLLPVIRLGFVGVGKGTTSNAFVQANMPNVTVNGEHVATMEYDALKLASGILYPPQVTVTFSTEQQTFSIESSPEEETAGFALADDQVYVVLLETVLTRVLLVAAGTRGEGGSATEKLPGGWTKENVKAYAFAVSAKGRDASDSQLLEVA